MRYTLWSRGRLLAETDLGFIYRTEHFRCGWLQPTELGERLLPMACGVPPALRSSRILGDDPTSLADIREAEIYEESLELELRGPDHAVIPTTDIGIIDTYYVLALPTDPDPDLDLELDAEAEAEIEEFLAAYNEDRREDELLGKTNDDEAAGDFPQYQIQAYLLARLPDHV